MFYQPCLRAKEFSRATILVPFLRQNILLSIFKILACCKIGSRGLDSRYYVEQANFFKKNFGKCSQIGCFKVRNSTQKTLTLWQSPSKGMLQNKSFTGNHGNVARRSPRGNMHKLYIKCMLNMHKLYMHKLYCTPLKLF